MAIQTPTTEYERALAENERYAATFDRPTLRSRRAGSSPSSPAWTPS